MDELRIPYKDVHMAVEHLEGSELCVDECNASMPCNELTVQQWQYDNGVAELVPCGVGSVCSVLPISQDGCRKRNQAQLGSVSESWECHNHQDDCGTTSLPFLAAPSSASAITLTVSSILNPSVPKPMTDTAGLAGSTCGPVGTAWDTLGSTRPACSDPVCAAAHLHLLGEALSLIGHLLKGTNKSVCVSSSLFLLLDSLLCALPPLMSLTSQIPELHSCTDVPLASAMENISYMMPGL